MLTIQQLLVVSGQDPGGPLSTDTLLSTLSPRPLSLRSVIAAFEKQRMVIFVSLVSQKILNTHNLRSLDDLARAASSPEGRMDSSEVLALSSNLRAHGLSLRILDQDLQKAAIVGLAPDLVNAPTLPISNGDLLKIQDKFSGGEAVGGAVLGGGAVLVGVGLAVATAPVWVLPVGAALVGFGFGFTITTGIMDILHDSPPPSKTNGKDSSLTPNDLGPDEPNDDTIEIPSAVAIGSSPEDMNLDGVLQELGDFSVDFTVDIVLSDLPVGFDTNSGVGLPGIPGGDDGDGGGIGGFDPFG